MRTLWISLISLLSLALAGCGASQDSGNQPQPPQSEENPSSQERNSPLTQLPVPTVGSVIITNTTATPVVSKTPEDSSPADPTFPGLTQEAMQHLANRLKVELDQVSYLKTVPARWPYDKLGCPLPEGKTTDENNPGYQILLAANGQTYTYHTDGIDWVVLCNIKPPNEIRTLP